mmetsp:Transcript_1292/g.3784  ORF Transcript_1292/g.3784 Transcript_1292/m.3784 type:complete len:99 (+) Transcript_1292:147-443(+)
MREMFHSTDGSRVQHCASSCASRSAHHHASSRLIDLGGGASWALCLLAEEDLACRIFDCCGMHFPRWGGVAFDFGVVGMCLLLVDPIGRSVESLTGAS